MKLNNKLTFDIDILEYTRVFKNINTTLLAIRLFKKTNTTLSHSKAFYYHISRYKVMINNK